MGYTHSWNFNGKAPKDVENASEKWAKASEIIKLIVKKVEERGIRIGNGVGKNSPIFNDKVIVFNGFGDESHESFGIAYGDPCDFDFCKTDMKPYDLAVTTSLLALKSVYGDDFNYRSDGVTRESIKDAKNIAYWKSIGWTPKIDKGWEQAYELWEEVQKEI